MKSKLFPAIIFFIFIVLCIGSCRNAGIWLVKEDNTLHADAIIILMGSIADRVLEASDLYVQGIANKIIIVESDPGINKSLEVRGFKILSNTEQSHDALVSMGVPDNNIIVLPGGAGSTRMEAEIIRGYLKSRPDIDTLLVVSSSYHTRRASMIFKSVFDNTDKQVYMICKPSNYTGFNAKKWWTSKEGIHAVLLEYMKMGNFLLFEKRDIRSKQN